MIGLILQLPAFSGLFQLEWNTKTVQFTVMCELTCRNSEEIKMGFVNFTTVSTHSQSWVESSHLSLVNLESFLNHWKEGY